VRRLVAPVEVQLRINTRDALTREVLVVVVSYGEAITIAHHRRRSRNMRQTRLRDNLLLRGGAAPAQLDVCISCGVEVLDTNVILLTRLQIDTPGVLGCCLLLPLVDEELTVDPQTNTVIGTGMEGVVWLYCACT
jgi:hypothetical protein